MCVCVCVYACVPLFLPDKVCVFLVSNSQTGQEAFLNPSPHAFELPGSVPMAGAGWGAPREELALFLSFLSLLGLVCPLPLPATAPHLSWAAFFPSRKPRGGGRRLESQRPFAITEPLLTSHRVPQQRIKELPQVSPR